MIGAIVGDIVGSVHEFNRTKTKEFPLFTAEASFTDDTVLTLAVAEWLLTGQDLIDLMQDAAAAHPLAGYGGMFNRWSRMRSREPYGSFGNGSAMRVSPVGFAFDDLKDVLAWAKQSAEVTHDHPEGIRGAQATAAAIWYARHERDRDVIRVALEKEFGYDLSTPLDVIRPGYEFDVTCQGSVPQALRAFLESTSFEDAIRNAVSLGGDADTLAAITGGAAEAYWGGVPEDIATTALARLEPGQRDVVSRFRKRFPGATSA